MSRLDGYLSKDQLRAANLADSRTLELRNVSSLASSRGDVQDLPFHHVTNCFFGTLHEVLESNHPYLLEGEQIARSTHLDNSRMRGSLLPRCFAVFRTMVMFLEYNKSSQG